MITGKTGTPDYMAPEVIRSNGAHGPATQYSYVSIRDGLLRVRGRVWVH